MVMAMTKEGEGGEGEMSKGVQKDILLMMGSVRRGDDTPGSEIPKNPIFWLMLWCHKREDDDDDDIIMI